jgi:hypothetical protein
MKISAFDVWRIKQSTKISMNAVKRKPLLVCGARLVYYCHETLSTPAPHWALYATCFACLLVHVFRQAWFCIKPYSSTVQHVFPIQQKNLAMFFIFKLCFKYFSYCQEMLSNPIELCPALVWLVLHMFFGPCMVEHKTMQQHGSTCLLIQQKNFAMFFIFKFCFKSLSENMVRTPGIDFWTEKNLFYFLYLNNFHSQKAFRRTIWFSAGLHCQAQKGRRKVLNGGR